MCRFVSIACRLQNKTQHLCWRNYVVSVSDRFNNIMRVISASYTNLALIPSNLRYIWGANVLMILAFKPETLTQGQLFSTIGMRNITTFILYVSLLVHHIKEHARYSSFNYCLSIWVINPNWTSEHNCLCSSASIQLHESSDLPSRAQYCVWA